MNKQPPLWGKAKMNKDIKLRGEADADAEDYNWRGKAYDKLAYKDIAEAIRLKKFNVLKIKVQTKSGVVWHFAERNFYIYNHVLAC